MNLIALGLLKEELEELESTPIPEYSYKQNRIDNLKKAIAELESIIVTYPKDDFINCKCSICIHSEDYETLIENERNYGYNENETIICNTCKVNAINHFKNR